MDREKYVNSNKITSECVRKTSLEMDLVPTDSQGDVNLVNRQSVNAWRMIYRLMDNVKTSMDSTYQGKNGSISNQDVDGIIDYIYMSLKNITKNTIESK